jgi:NIMA-interacting peptidyl-prolyl cis-trans isomerase 1
MRLRLHPAWALSILILACADLTEPGPGAPTPVKPATAAEAQGEPAAAPPPQPAEPAPSQERIGAAHVLIAYKGALRAAPSIARSKEEARKLAGEVASKAQRGDDFAALAEKYSDDPSAKGRGGSLGTFGRDQMVKPFADAAFALKPGQVSSVVETDFGFHVIRRTE